MAQVINPHTGEQRNIHNGDTVYVIRRDGNFQHTAHRVRRVSSTHHAVTHCTIWIRDIAVLSTPEDIMVWCENGCKPTTPNEAHSGN